MVIDGVMVVLNTVASYSSDVLAFVGLTILFVVWGLVKDKEALILFLIGLYAATLLTISFPYDVLSTVFITNTGGILARATVFVLGIFAAWFAFARHVAALFPEGGPWRLVEVIALGVAATTLLVSTLYHVVGVETLFPLGPTGRIVFESWWSFIVWLLAPLAVLILVIRK